MSIKEKIKDCFIKHPILISVIVSIILMLLKSLKEYKLKITCDSIKTYFEPLLNSTIDTIIDFLFIDFLSVFSTVIAIVSLILAIHYSRESDKKIDELKIELAEDILYGIDSNHKNIPKDYLDNLKSRGKLEVSEVKDWNGTIYFYGDRIYLKTSDNNRILILKEELKKKHEGLYAGLNSGNSFKINVTDGNFYQGKTAFNSINVLEITELEILLGYEGYYNGMKTINQIPHNLNSKPPMFDIF